jgi:hypothetical protein
MSYMNIEPNYDGYYCCACGDPHTSYMIVCDARTTERLPLCRRCLKLLKAKIECHLVESDE